MKIPGFDNPPTRPNPNGPNKPPTPHNGSPEPRRPKIRKVGDGLTGNTETSCAACGEPGHMYTVEGLPDGYIDACDEHKEDIAADALADYQRMVQP